MNTFKIIERKFPTEHFLVRKVFGDVSALRNTEAYGHLVYFDEYDPKIITASLVYLQDWENQPDGFFNFVEEDLTFDECLIVSTLYFSHPTPLIRKILTCPIRPIEDHLQHILKPTNGYLIYSFQFEQLAQLIMCVSLGEAVRIRKVYNKQRSLIKLNDSDDAKLKEFKKIVQKHAITGCVHLPNYEGAKNLYLYAQSFA